MKNSKLENRLIFSDRRPFIPTASEVSAGTIMGSIRKFAEKYLDGIAILHLQNMPPLGTVCVTFEQLAYAIKLTLRHFAITEPVEFDFRVVDDEFRVSVFLSEEPSLKAAAEIADAFRKAGFSTKGFGLALMFAAPFKETRHLSLREPNTQVYVMLLEKIFFR